MSAVLPYVFALYPLVLSAVALVWLHRARKRSRLQWAMHVLTSGSIVVFLYLTGPWVFTSRYLRHAVLGLYVLAAIASFRRAERRDRSAAAGRAPWPVVSALVLIPFAVLNAVAIGSRLGPADALDLSFPLKSGTYVVLQGGSGLLANPFHALGGSRFALDLSKLNAFGNRASGIAPRDLHAYEIFGETLYSPCDGRVLALRDGRTDNTPGDIDPERSAGNHLVLQCARARVLMAHLKRGSIRVARGEVVATGQPVGEVGNSGNTMEPHLHIEATIGEAAVPLRFDGRSLTTNSIVHGGQGP